MINMSRIGIMKVQTAEQGFRLKVIQFLRMSAKKCLYVFDILIFSD